ncbi:MAG TPA: Ig-like domain-containing protein [Longimicrobium sp.]
MFRLKSAAAAVLILGIGACTGDAGSPMGPDGGQPLATISDAAHAGAVPGFYFLPPMVPSPAYSGTFDGGLQPRVEICELAAGVCVTTIAQYTTTSGTGGQTVQVGTSSYQVNWHTNQFNLDPAKTYRISVYVGSFQLGFADVDVVATGKELKNVDTQQYIPLQDDRTLPIKFRIETGIAAQVIVSPDSAEIGVGETQQFTATTLDLHGNPLACTATWTSSNTATATVDGNGLATGVAPGSTIITATCQAASGSAYLAVIDPNTPPVGEDDAFEAIGNVTVPVSAPGVLANDTDGENDSLQAVAGTFPTSGGGTVTLNADGSFTYLSAAGFTGEDSFTYTVTDGQDSVSATATVTSAYRVWYVDNAAAGPGDGRDASPFSTLAGAEGASTAGETIFVRTGAAPYDGGIVLKTGQSLTGQGVPANVTATLNGETVVLLAAGSAPTITKTAGGATIQLATNNVVQGVAVTSSAGAGIAGTGFGTLTVGSTSVAAVGGPALDLSSGDVSGSFDALSSSGSTGAGIRLVGVGGSFSAANGSITGSTGAGVDVTGGAGTFSYGGDIAVVGPLAVSVTGRTGGALTFGGTIASTGSGIEVQGNSGGTIAFTGSSKSLSTGANPGVSLANNAGASISFGGGGLAVATTTGTGFSATGGGTVTVTGAGNTVVSAGGTAVQVENTTIGAAGITWRSVSANGGANGIVLSSTGALNGMQVTGTGVAGSGGTIQNMVGADGSTTGIGVYLSGTRSISLDWMQLNDFANFAVRGVNVAGFSLGNSVVSGTNGTSAAVDEGSISFSELTGSAAITSSTVSGGFENNVTVVNTGGVLDRIVLSGTTVGPNGTLTGDDGLRIEATGAAVVNVSLLNSAFTSARGDLFQLLLLGTSTSDLVITGTTFSNAHPAITAGGGGVTVGSGGGANPTFTYAISGNSFRDALGTALVVRKGAGTGSFAGTIANNVIGVAAVANSGSAQGSGIDASTVGGGVHTVAITGNQIRQYNNMGILLTAGTAASGGNGALNATVTGNTIANPGTLGSLPMNGIHLNAGTNTGDAHPVCLAVSGNSLTGSGALGGTDFRLRQRFATTVRLPGYADTNTNTAAVVTFVSGQNGGASGTASVTVPPGGGFVGGAACPQP